MSSIAGNPKGVGRLRIVVANVMPPELHRYMVGELPQYEVVCDQALLPPSSGPAEFGGPPGWKRSPEDQQRFEELLATADIMYGIPELKPSALRAAVEANPRLRWVQTMAAGGGAQVKAAQLRAEHLQRIIFTTAAGVHSGTLAEFALFSLLAGAKNLPHMQRNQREHIWAARWVMRQLHEMTVLVYGLGRIGVETAQHLKALGARVVGVSRRPRPELAELDRLITPEEVPGIMPEVHALVVTLPGTDSTTGIVGEKIFGAARPGLIFCNVGRGTAVDEPALVSALSSGQVSFAGLDVTAVEPLPADSPLWDLPNVLISPHTAALSNLEEQRIAELFIENARRFAEGKPLENVVDTVEFY